MFCVNCGAKMNSGQNFCAICGTSVQQPAQSQAYAPVQPQQYQQQQTQYAPRWILGGTVKQSLLKSIMCYVLFYQDRMIIAHISNEQRNEFSRQESERIKQSNVGFFKGSAQMMGFWSNFQQRYNTMSQEQILHENPMNMLLYYNNIQLIKYNAYDAGNQDENSSGGKMRITMLNGNKVDIRHQVPHSKAIQNTLTSILGMRLKYKNH